MAGYIGSKASVTQVDGYNRTEADDRYANITGDTFTGAITGTNITLSGGVYLGGTGAANLLDDYEEGTYTPSITGGQVTLNTGMNELFYTKVGRLVTVTGRIRILSIINSTGNLSISLPFTSASSSTNGGYASFQIITYNITLVTGTVSTFGELGNSSSLIGVSCQRDNNTWAAIPLTSLAGGDYIHVSGSYQTD